MGQQNSQPTTSQHVLTDNCIQAPFPLAQDNSKPTSSQDHLTNLNEKLKCTICFKKPTDAHICPNCSNLYCFQCIEKWITNSGKECPTCCVSLNLNELVKVRWFEDVTTEIDNVVNKCIIDGHKPIDNTSIFCLDCNTLVNPVSVVIGAHENHEKEILYTLYQEYLELLTEDVGRAKEHILGLNRLYEKLGKSMEQLELKKTDILRDVENFTKSIDADYSTQLKTFEDLRSNVSHEIESVKSLQQETQSFLATAEPIDLIVQYSAISSKLDDSLKDIPSAPHISEFHRFLMPPYQTRRYFLRGYSNKRQSGGSIFSQALNSAGLRWKLCVYPDGHGPAEGKYLSVFIQLFSDLTRPSKFQCRIEMFHQETKDPVRNKVIECKGCVAKCGDVIGCYEFHPLDRLEMDGYLLQNQLGFKFHVRDVSYAQAYDRMNAYFKKVTKYIDKDVIFCCDCNTVVGSDSVISGGEHADHQRRLLHQVYDERMELLQEDLRRIEEYILGLNNLLADIQFCDW